jgi:hypothetical protein
MNSSDPNERLSATLASWRVTPPRDPHFRPAVLERIRQTARDTWSGYVRAHLVGWSAAALVAIAAAGWTGRAVAQAKMENHREQMVVAYLGNLDPRVLAKLRN